MEIISEHPNGRSVHTPIMLLKRKKRKNFANLPIVPPSQLSQCKKMLHNPINRCYVWCSNFRIFSHIQGVFMKKTIITLAATLAFTALVSGCNTSIVDKVTVAVNPNLQSATISLLFNSSISPQFGGDYPVSTYGDAFVNEATATTPFTVGFDLNLSILNDQNYINLTPTTVLPTGTPIPSVIGHPVAEVDLKNAISPNYNVYAYVDVPTTLTKGDWIGVAVILKVTNQYFPSGLSIAEDFLNDKNGNPQASAIVFGPKLDPATGDVLVPGGIAIFANVRDLITGQTATGALTTSASSVDPTVLFNGSLVRAGNVAF